jgi:hypothetical protein
MEEMNWEDSIKELVEIGLTYALAKACIDYHHYALGLKNGQIFLFKQAEYIKGRNYISLKAENCSVKLSNVLEIGLGRGVDIMLSEIAWVADDPYGH